MRRFDAISTAIAVRVRPVARVLAVDVGTSSVRAQIFEADAQEGEATRREYPGETDPARLVALVREAIDEAVAGHSYDAVGASCFGHSLLALDEHGRPLTPVLGWRDTRSADAADWLSRRVDADAVHARTGCHIHTSYWPAKLEEQIEHTDQRGAGRDDEQALRADADVAQLKRSRREGWRARALCAEKPQSEAGQCKMNGD